MNMTKHAVPAARTTLVPPSYPELEAEIYRALAAADLDSQTILPPAGELELLVEETAL